MALIRLAIIGGGLAGTSLAHALLQYPHIDFNIYESVLQSAPEFSERGAAVGLPKNAQRATALASPSLRAAIDKAGAVACNAGRFMIGEGPYRGSFIGDGVFANPGLLVVGRSPLLQEIIKPIPKDKMHTNKKVVTVQNIGHAVEVRFKDGSEILVDAVVGADGIHSEVRKYVLEGKGAIEPSFAGWWDCRCLVPAEQAISSLGTDILDPKNPQQHCWVGDGKFILHDVLNNGTTMQVIAAVLTEKKMEIRRMEASIGC